MQSHSATSLRSEERADLSVWKSPVIAFLGKYSIVLCLLLVAIACARIISTYNALSVTADEPFHLACAIEYLSYHTITLDVENPPIAQAIEGLGPYFAGLHHLTGRQSPFVEGAEILANSGNVDGMIFRLRLGTLPFFMLACCVGIVYLSFLRQSLCGAGGCSLHLPADDAGRCWPGYDRHGAGSLHRSGFSGGNFLGRKARVGTSHCHGFVHRPRVPHEVDRPGVCGLVPILRGISVLAYFCDRLARFAADSARYYKTFALGVATTIVSMWAAYWFSFGQIPGHHSASPHQNFSRAFRSDQLQPKRPYELLARPPPKNRVVVLLSRSPFR